MSYIKRFHFVAGLIIIMLLASCTPVTPITPTPAPTSTATVTSTPTVRPTRTPYPTVAPSPTPEPEVNVIESKSLDGLWVASIEYRYLPNKSTDNVQITFTVRSNSQQPVERQVESYFATSSKPFLIPSVFEWSKDGIHIYYSHTFTGADGCYPSDYSNLMKFNIITGEVTEVLNGRASEFSLSPDETQLAYNANWGRVITMRDLKTRNEYDIEPPKQFADMPYAMSTSFAWSSDGGFLAYTFVDDPCWVAETNAVVLVNTFSHQQKVLVVKTDRMPLWVERFLNDNAILLQDWEGHYWIVDIQTLELTQVK